MVVSVGTAFGNRPPVIVNVPPDSVVANRQFSYDLAATDADRDAYTFELLRGPVGMSLDPICKTVRWTPGLDQVGPHSMTVRATDSYGAAGERTFVVTVQRAGGPPTILSVPDVEAVVGRAFLYTVQAADAQNDPLTYTLLVAPVGMSIDGVTGELAWTPAANQIGTLSVVIRVDDGTGGFATQGFAVVVAAGVSNRPPRFTSAAVASAEVGTSYALTLAATDPDGDSLTFGLRRGPTGMTVDSKTGVVNWTPAPSDVGTVVVAFTATDAFGAAAVQSFELDVRAKNASPTVAGSAPATVPAGAAYRFDAVAADADLDPLTFELAGAPAGMKVDAFGRVRWQTGVADIGPHSFTVRVADGRGGAAEQSVTFGVVADSSAPRVVVLPVCRPSERIRRRSSRSTTYRRTRRTPSAWP